ncbi:MAG: DUF4190 domain-containing protein [Chloracidobacterium sp.]|nr:DUF4190 domain-containing protein [Chloracidobacterium sp.]
MKKCPTCGKEFEDSLKFCQIDGAELVEQEAAFDPYATVVGYKFDPSADKTTEAVEDAPVEGPTAEASVEETAAGESLIPAAEPAIHETTGSIPIAPPDEVLELPGMDPLKTMYVSESELKEALAAESSGQADAAPPPSPFGMPDSPVEPSAPPMGEMETVLSDPTALPFQEPAPVAEWSPPPAPDAVWQNQEIGSNTPFQPPPAGAGAGGENKTLAIVSLVCGILSLICCSWFVPAIAAIVMGFIARGKANSDPANYGGAGLAMGGIITGGISILVGIVVIILYVLGAFAGVVGNSF